MVNHRLQYRQNRRRGNITVDQPPLQVNIKGGIIVELTKYEREFLQLYRDADESGKLFMWDLLICAASCGEDFFQELMVAVKDDKAAIRAVVAKWKATIQEAVAV